MATEATPGDRSCPSFFESEFLDGYDGDNDSDDFYAELQVHGGGYEGPYRFLHDEDDEEEEEEVDFRQHVQQQICDFATSLRYSILEPIQEEQEEVSDEEDDDDLQQSDSESRSSEVWCWGDDFTSDGAESVIYVGDRNTATLTENNNAECELVVKCGQKRDLSELGEGNWLDRNGQEVDNSEAERMRLLRKKSVSSSSKSMPELRSGTMTQVTADSTDDSDLIIVFEEYETSGAKSLKKSKTSPNLNDFCVDHASNADAWSDAIDAYLDILRYPHEAAEECLSAVNFQSGSINPSDTLNSEWESCTMRSSILGDDLPPVTRVGPESSPSLFSEKDGQMTIELHGPETASEDEILEVKLEMKLPSRLRGVRSSPSLLGVDVSSNSSCDDDINSNYLFFSNGATSCSDYLDTADDDDDDYSKSRSEPCVKSVCRDEELVASTVGGQNFSAKIKYFSRDMNKSGSGSLDKSFESDYSYCSSSSSDDDEDFNMQFSGSATFPKGFAPMGTLRSFRSFDTLNLAGRNLDDEDSDYGGGSISRLVARHSWTMNDIEESLVENQNDADQSKPVHPSSDDLSKDSGYSDSDKANYGKDHGLDGLLGRDTARRDRVQLLANTRKNTYGYSDEIRSTCVCALNGITICAHDESHLQDSDESYSGPELITDLGEFQAEPEDDNLLTRNNEDVTVCNVITKIQPKFTTDGHEKLEDEWKCHSGTAVVEIVGNGEVLHDLSNDHARKLDSGDETNSEYLQGLKCTLKTRTANGLEEDVNDPFQTEENHSTQGIPFATNLCINTTCEATINDINCYVDSEPDSKLPLPKATSVTSTITSKFQHQIATNENAVVTSNQVSSVLEVTEDNSTCANIGKRTMDEVTSEINCKVEITRENLDDSSDLLTHNKDVSSRHNDCQFAEEFANQQPDTSCARIVHFHEFFYCPEKNSETTRKITAFTKFSSFSTSDSEIYNSTTTTTTTTMLSGGTSHHSSLFSSAGENNGCNGDGNQSNTDSMDSNNEGNDNSKSVRNGKPPLPNRQLAPCRAKIINARNEFFTGQDVSLDDTTVHGDNINAKDSPSFELLAEQFRQRAKEGRERVAKTVLDLNEIERTVLQKQNQQISTELPKCDEIDMQGQSETKPAFRGAEEARPGISCSDAKDDVDNCNIEQRDTSELFLNGKVEDDNTVCWSATSPLNLKTGTWRNNRSYGYLETDIDTLHSREVIIQEPDKYRNRSFRNCHSMKNMKTQSMFNLASEMTRPVAKTDTLDDSNDPRAKSMEFLLDNDENLAALLPPENQLMAAATFNDGGGGGSNTKVSEHELRIRRSLQKLDLPDWYVNSPLAQMGSQEGFLLRNHDKNATKTPVRQRWQDVKSQSSSATSLQMPGKNVVISKRVSAPDWRQVKSSRESLLQSPESLATTGHLQYNCNQSGWTSGSCMSSTAASSRSSSPTGSLSNQNRLTSPFQRQPYLGWRSSERIARQPVGDSGTTTPTNATGFTYRTAAERLSRGPGYYSMRFGNLHRTSGSDRNLSQNGGLGDCGQSATTSSPSLSIASHMMDPNGCYENSDSNHLEVAELVRQIDSLIHMNGHVDNNGHDENFGDMNSSPKSTAQQKPVWMESSFVGVKIDPDGLSSTMQCETITPAV